MFCWFLFYLFFKICYDFLINSLFVWFREMYLGFFVGSLLF